MFAVGVLGMSADDFWDLTYYDLNLLATAYNRRRIRDHNNLIITAWHTAMFERQKKLPDLEKCLVKEEQPKRRKQTDEEMMAMAKILNAAFGGEYKEI